jgi:hypothetical protein
MTPPGQASELVTVIEHLALEANKTLFNLVTCNRELEIAVAVAKFCDRAPAVAAFEKTTGSQCLRVDYLANGDRLTFYTLAFFIRTIDHHYYLIDPEILTALPSRYRRAGTLFSRKSPIAFLKTKRE